MDAPTDRIVALVQCLNGIQHPRLFFQVTLDPDRIWPGTKFIRFGMWSGDDKGQGDELTGWMHLDEWALVQVFGKVSADGKTVSTGL